MIIKPAQRWRPLLLAPAMLGIVVLSSLGVDALSAFGLLAVSGVLLLGTAMIWTRRDGLASPVPIIALGLFAYFPFRGLILLTSGLTNQQGINQRVLDGLNSNGALTASIDVLLISALFALTCELLWHWRKVRIRTPRRAEMEAAENPALRSWANVLLVVGTVGVILQVPAGLGYLQGDEASGGLGWYLIYLASFCFCLGIILSGRINGRLPARVWLLLGLIGVAAFYMGSKDTLFQPLLALLFAGAGLTRARSSIKRACASAAAVLLLVFVVFPAVTTYRNEIFAGETTGQALVGVPGELISKTIVGSVPRGGGVPGYVEDCLLYLTNRLSGFDALVLTSDGAHDSQILTPQALALFPLGIVMPSGYWSSSVDQPGHYFGQQYWGSAPTNNVSVAVTMFGEVHLAFGVAAVPVAAILLALITVVAARNFRAPGRVARAFGFILMISAIAFERDVLYLLITTERRVLLLIAVVGLAAIGRRRMAPVSWRSHAALETTPAAVRRISMGAR